MKCLYVGYYSTDQKVGANVVRRNILAQLEKLDDLQVIPFFIRNESNRILLLRDYLLSSFNGGNLRVRRKFREYIDEKNPDLLFLDGSYFGSLITLAKQESPGIRVITYFHNIEQLYYEKRLKKLGFFKRIILNKIIKSEKVAASQSDRRIVLSERDKSFLYSYYESRQASILPICLEDKFDSNRIVSKASFEYLFIGSAFYANLEGVKWFIKEVLPHVAGTLEIVGKGMEILKTKFSNVDRLIITGSVDDISKYYYSDSIIVSPILSGSGMKTKTIEALMYGKSVIGTSEAFVGINADVDKMGKLCNKANEFISTLNSNNTTKYSSHNEYSRNVYLQHHTPLILKKRLMNEILKINS